MKAVLTGLLLAALAWLPAAAAAPADDAVSSAGCDKARQNFNHQKDPHVR